MTYPSNDCRIPTAQDRLCIPRQVFLLPISASLCRPLTVTLASLFLGVLPVHAQEKPKQLVMISFDGAGNNALWERSREMAKRVNAHFTYFLSCTLVIDRARAKTYEGPQQKPGRSNIGFAQTAEEARTRLDHIWNAHLEGHEIASHTCGHFDGRQWSSAQWREEMVKFRSVLTSAWGDLDAGDREPQGWRPFIAGIKGFRAPYLSTSEALNTAEKQEGFAYDASGVTKGPMRPRRENGVLNFGLPLIPEGPEGRNIIAMDYNLFIRHSAGVENPSRSAEFEDRAYSAFRKAFDAQYDGERLPLQFGFHFVLMNGGAYWRALDRLASDICSLPDVACVTYGEAMAALEKTGAPGRGHDTERAASGL
ncbi:polysaccharide deacetylase family protein [Neorhizobium galegae]|uniref:polysaccharide deacetylase family protein n=1 Tax=Neorhizobium galegae TaxID=399 RepID=UPI001AEB06DC